MSGPVVNGLAQLEDALLEMGLEKELIFQALLCQLGAVSEHVEEVRQRVGGVPVPLLSIKRRLWEHLAALRPVWGLDEIENDHAEANRLEGSPAFHLRRWLVGGGVTITGVDLGNGDSETVMLISTPLPRAALPEIRWRTMDEVFDAAMARVVPPTAREEVSVRIVNWSPPPRPRSRVPEFLQHKPGRVPRR